MTGVIGTGIRSRTSIPDEGDGDLGLQGLHLEASPPRTNSNLRPADSPIERGHSLHVIMNRFGSQESAKASSSSIGSTSYFSAREGGGGGGGGESSRIGNSDDSPTSVEVSPSGASSPNADGNASSYSPKTRSGSGKTKNRFSKLRTEIDPEGQVSLVGNGNMTTSPRLLSSPKSRRKSSNNTKSEIQPNALTGGTSSTGLLLGNPSSEFKSSNDSASNQVSVPGRGASLPSERGKRKSRGSVGTSSIDTNVPESLKESIAMKRAGSDNSVKESSLAPLVGLDSLSKSIEASLQRWVLSIGCVNFDLDKGPDLEFLYPSLGISREERDNIAFSSFPDTSIFDDGQAVFSWRVREVPLNSSLSEAPIIAGPKKSRSGSQQASPLPSPNSSGRFSTLPSMTRKGSSSASSGQHHKLFNFERGWKSPNRTHSSDDTDPTMSALADSNSSSRNASPLPSRGGKGSTLNTSNQVPASSPLESEKSSDNISPMESLGNNGSIKIMTSEKMTVDTANLTQQSDKAQNGLQSIPLSSSFNNGTKTSTSSNFIHGYCFFRQRRDATIRRGYFQKSVVILSHLPYVSLFSEIVKRLGPLFFEIGMPALEAFSQDVHNWPHPEPGARMHLPLLGSVLSVDLPYQSQFQTSLAAEARIVQNVNAPGKARSGLHVKPDSRSLQGSENEPILASIPSTPLFDIFRESLDDLWLLWECVLLAEPILVVGPDPRICSEAVWHLLDLIRPIPFAGDFRPFFTIHDYDFKTLVTKNKPNAGVMLGVTNPFMLQACKHWPHVFKVGKGSATTSSLGGSKVANRKLLTSNDSTLPGGNGVKPVSGGIAGGNSAGGGGPEHTPGLLSKRKRRISKDRPLLRKLQEMAENESDDEAANAMLRRYFSDLTEQFLAPLNRYVSSLAPTEFDLSSPAEIPRMKPFNTLAFLASLKAQGTPLPIRSRNLPTGAAVRQSLYQDFIQCPNFSLWLQNRIVLSEEEQYNRRLRALEIGNIDTFVSCKSELETIDLYSRLEAEIGQIDKRLLATKKDREIEPNSRWKSSVAVRCDVSPAIALSSEPSTTTTAKKIEELIRTSGNTLTSGEKSLLVKKIHLIEQLETLVKRLPADTRDSLRLKSSGRRF